MDKIPRMERFIAAMKAFVKPLLRDGVLRHVRMPGTLMRSEIFSKVTHTQKEFWPVALWIMSGVPHEGDMERIDMLRRMEGDQLATRVMQVKACKMVGKDGAEGGSPFPEEWDEENSGIWWEKPYPEYFVEVDPEETKASRLVRREVHRLEGKHALEVRSLERKGGARVELAKAMYEQERAAAEATIEEKRRRRGVEARAARINEQRRTKEAAKEQRKGAAESKRAEAREQEAAVERARAAKQGMADRRQAAEDSQLGREEDERRRWEAR